MANTTNTAASQDAKLQIEVITDARDIAEAYKLVSTAFGQQTQDGFWIAMNPGWDSPEGAEAGSKRMLDRFLSATKNHTGDLNTVFVKATLPGVDNHRTMVGLSIWQQASVVDGWGDAPVEDPRRAIDLESRFPGNESEQRFITQLYRSLYKPRNHVIKDKAAASPPAVMIMDVCVVDPKFQRRGIAQQLVTWGLDEARQRGGLEVITEASTMGRKAYAKMGFNADAHDIVFEVDAEFRNRDISSNIFMRTSAL